MERYRLFSSLAKNKYVKDDKEIIIFPDEPYWMVMTNGSYDFLKQFTNPIGIDEIKDENLDFVKELIEVGILVEENATTEKNEECKNGVLNSVWLDVISKCNLRCKHCFEGEKECISNILSVEEIKNFGNSLCKIDNPLGINVEITGGEPLLRNDILDVLEALNNKHINRSIVTNGLLLNEEIIDYMASESIPITISIDGITTESHEFIRGKNTFNRTIENIKKCIDKGIRTTLSMTVHEGNKNEVLGMYGLGAELGADTVLVNFLNDFGFAKDNGLVITEETPVIKSVLEEAVKNDEIYNLVKKSNISKLIATVLFPIKTSCCGTGISTCSVRADGNVYPCPSFQCDCFCAGNIREKPFEQIWNSKDSFIEHRKVDISTLNDVCSNCDVRFFCGGGCRAQAYYSNGNTINSRSKKCADYRKTYLELMWMIDKYPKLQDLCEAERMRIYE